MRQIAIDSADYDKAAKYLVTTYMNASKYDDAIAYFKDLYSKHPDDAQAVQTVAMLYGKKGDFEQSMEWQRKRVKLEPNNADVYYTMGATAWQQSYDHPGDAIDPAKRKQIIDEGMENLPLHLTMGMYLSIPMVLFGLWLIWRGMRETPKAPISETHEPA